MKKIVNETKNDVYFNNECDFLNTLDIKQIIDLHFHESTRDIMQLIKNRYNQVYKDKFEIDIDLFEYMGERGFIQYVNERYNIGTYVCSQYYFDCY